MSQRSPHRAGDPSIRGDGCAVNRRVTRVADDLRLTGARALNRRQAQLGVKRSVRWAVLSPAFMLPGVVPLIASPDQRRDFWIADSQAQCGGPLSPPHWETTAGNLPRKARTSDVAATLVTGSFGLRPERSRRTFCWRTMVINRTRRNEREGHVDAEYAVGTVAAVYCGSACCHEPGGSEFAASVVQRAFWAGLAAQQPEPSGVGPGRGPSSCASVPDRGSRPSRGRRKPVPKRHVVGRQDVPKQDVPSRTFRSRNGDRGTRRGAIGRCRPGAHVVRDCCRIAYVRTR